MRHLVSERWRAVSQVAAGLVLVGIALALSRISHEFIYGSPLAERPHRTLVALLMFAGAVYLLAVWLVTRVNAARLPIAVLLLLGVVMRVPFFASNPIQEDDYYRYLWDGGVVTAGVNPYSVFPADVAEKPRPDHVSAQLHERGDASGLVLQRVNHPELGTIYPPVAQAAFAAAHLLRPWSLNAWRATLFFADGIAVVILLLVLRDTGKPPAHCIIYWWNPLLLKEVYNSAHMDILVAPFALAALWFAIRSKPFRSAMALALAIGTKLWPVLLVPLLARAIDLPRKKIVAACVLGVLCTALVLSPLATVLKIGDQSGFVAYGERWEMNDALFMVALAGTKGAANLLGLDTGWEEGLARATVFAIVLAVGAFLTLRPVRDGVDLSDRIAILVGVVFMLSPTQFPWYFLWMLPFLAVRPRPSLLILTLMLPMYYLKFYYSAQGNVAFFHNRLVWIEYAPVFALAGWEIAQALRRATRTASHA